MASVAGSGTAGVPLSVISPTALRVVAADVLDAQKTVGVGRGSECPGETVTWPLLTTFWSQEPTTLHLVVVHVVS